MVKPTDERENMDFEKLIFNAEDFYECVGLIAMDDSVTNVSATTFHVPYRYVRLHVEYVDADLNHAETTFDLERNRSVNRGNDEPMFIIIDCE